MQSQSLASGRFPRACVFALAILVVASAAERALAQPAEERLKHRWERLRFAEPPRRTPFSEGVAVYDPFHRQFLVHEGSATSIAALPVDGHEWLEVPLSPIGPTSRASHAAAFDVARRAMIVFGGSGGFEGRLADVWSFDTRRHAWTRLDDPEQADRPPTRSNSTIVVDPARDRLLVYGGITGLGLDPKALGDLWEFDLSSRRWRQIVPASGPVPRARLAHVAVFDVNRDRMLVFGGQHAEDGVVENLNELWSFDAATETWAMTPPTSAPDGPPPLLDAAFVTDGWHRAYLVGGSSGTLPLFFSKDVRVLDLRTDTWKLLPDLNDDGTQIPGGPGGPGGGPGQPPREALTTLPPIAHHVAAYVPGDARSADGGEKSGRIYVFGGAIQKKDLSFEYRLDTWIYRRPTRLFHR